jgi:hypothetical protein
MTVSKLTGLAERMKALIEAEERRRSEARSEAERAAAARRELEARMERRKAEGRAARAALLDEVVTFSSAIGHLTAKRGDDGAVALGYRGRRVLLEPDGDDDRIAIRLDDEIVPRNHHLARDGEEWELVFDHGTTVVRFDLESGLTHLLREHLLVPLPPSDALPVHGIAEPEEAAVAAEPEAPVAAQSTAPAPTATEPAAPARKRKVKGPPGSELKELKGRLA